MALDFNVKQLGTMVKNLNKYLDSICIIEEYKNEVIERICSAQIVLEEGLSVSTDEERQEIEELLALIEDVKNKHMPKSSNTSKTLS